MNVYNCRLCNYHELVYILNLGSLAQCGKFLKLGEELPRLPVHLCRCAHCGLLQLGHAYPMSDMFEDGYGYRSSLNGAMMGHLETVAQDLMERFPLHPADTIIDIGANDGTFLRNLPLTTRQIAVDPGMKQYSSYYEGHEPKYLSLVDGYFPACDVPCNPKQARLITSIAMFYDVHRPLEFAERVRELLAADGIWYCEQLYAGEMVERCLFDAICHEHATYWGVAQLALLASRAGLKIIDLSFNPTNGGSIATIFARADSPYAQVDSLEYWIAREARSLSFERANGFAGRALASALGINKALRDLRDEGRAVLGIGASTKGNVLLQFAGISPTIIGMIGEVNQDKVGLFTPGTNIPIVPESEVLALEPEYLLVLPWHFRDGMIDRFSPFVANGGKLIFPLPQYETYP